MSLVVKTNCVFKLGICSVEEKINVILIIVRNECVM